MKIRIRLQEFFTEHAVGWEFFMIALAVIYVGSDVVSFFIEYPPALLNAVIITDWAINIVFVVEFVTRFIIAPSWWLHLKTHWLDLIAVLPFIHWLRFTRLAYIVRFLRFARLARVCSSLDRLEYDLMSLFRLNGLGWIMLTMTGFMFVSSLLLYYFEHPVNDKITTYWDALYASLVTWTTPGYGEIFPVTMNGRVCGLVLIISGLITWGVLVANLAAFLSARRKAENISDPAVLELHNKLLRIGELSRLELISFRGAINAMIDNKIDEK